MNEISTLDQAGFIEQVGWVCEHSPWVAERAWARRPFRKIDDLHEALVGEILTAPDTEKRDLLNAHPDLGTRARMAVASASEQAGAGLDRLTPQEFEELTSLNGHYRRKFGFPFLYAVKGSDKQQILDSLRARMNNGVAEEFAEALRQTARIIRFRLETIVDTQDR